VVPTHVVFQAVHEQLAHVAAGDADDLAISTGQRLALDTRGLPAECLARQRVDSGKSSAARLAARIVEFLEVGRPENVLNGIKALCGEAKPVALCAEDDGCVALEDEERDLGAVEGAGEKEGGNAGTGDEDGLWGAHGGCKAECEIWQELSEVVMA
jgi:hypothetical protein